MTAQIITLRTAPVRALHNDSLRADCERLMRRLVKDGRTPEHELRILAYDGRIRHEPMPSLPDNKDGAFRGEEAVTSALIEVTEDKPAVCYVTKGHGELGLEDASPVRGMSLLSRQLRNRNFEVRQLDLATVADYTHLTALLAGRSALLTYNAKDNCCFASDHALAPLLAADTPALLTKLRASVPAELGGATMTARGAAHVFGIGFGAQCARAGTVSISSTAPAAMLVGARAS